jgi:uncharacterized protein YqgC (DUF456 family)
LLSGIPILGTLFGALIGSILGTGAVTYWEQRNLRQAWRAAQSYLVGCALSSLIEIMISCLMLAIFFWRVFF